MQLYKEDKEWIALPNDSDTVNEEDDDKAYESENWGESWKNYKDDKYITNNELEVVGKKIPCEILVIKKLGLTKRNLFLLYIFHVVKFSNYGWKKKIYYTS